MTDHFNGLTPAQAERLAMLAEEAGEIVQVVGKILRHGYKSAHPDSPRITNRSLLERELMDLHAVAGKMDECGDICFGPTVETDVDIWMRKRRYTHHQGRL